MLTGPPPKFHGTRDILEPGSSPRNALPDQSAVPVVPQRYDGILSIENEDPILAGEVGVERAAYVLKNVRNEILGA